MATRAHFAFRRRQRFWSRRLLVNGDGVAVRIGEGEGAAEGTGSGMSQDRSS